MDKGRRSEHVHLLKDDGTVGMTGPSGGEAVEHYLHEGADVGDTVKIVLPLT